MNLIALAAALLLAPIPGRTNPYLTKAIICAPDFRTGVYRHVSEAMKQAVCRRDHAVPCDGKHFEIDHLVPIEIGGSNDRDNLWAQPIQQARIKDKLENQLHEEVCAGRLSLEDAQHCIAEDWGKCKTQRDKDVQFNPLENLRW